MTPKNLDFLPIGRVQDVIKRKINANKIQELKDKADRILTEQKKAAEVNQKIENAKKEIKLVEFFFYFYIKKNIIVDENDVNLGCSIAIV